MTMKLILTGATGNAGSQVLKAALADPAIEKVTVLTRRSVGVSDPKLTEIKIADFTDYSAVTSQLKGYDACLWCLGISQKAVSKGEYLKITEDYTAAATTAFHEANPNMRFLFLSGAGANREETGWFLFQNVKGRAEKTVSKVFGENAYCFRPGYIVPDPSHPTKLTDSLARPIFPAFNALSFGTLGVKAQQLGVAMVRVAKTANPDKHIFDNKDVLSLSK